MKQMTKIEGFKETEIGVLPKDWEVKNLNDFFEFSKKPRNLQINNDDIIPFIPMELISEDHESITGWQLKKMSEISSGTFVFKDDLIVAKITPSFENGKQAILSNLPHDFAYATTEVWALHPKDSQGITSFLYNYIKISDIRHSLASKMEGATGRQRLPRNVLENLLIPSPSLPEQQKIASVLSAVQEAKEKTENVLSALKELKKSMMKHLFTYGAVSLEEAQRATVVSDSVIPASEARPESFRFPLRKGGAGVVRKDSGQARNDNKLRLKETEIGMIPEHWEVIRVGDVIEIVSGGTPSRNEPEYWNGTIPWVKTGEISYNIISVTEEKITEKGLNESSARVVPKGTLLMAMYGQGVTRGRVAILGIDASINQACAAFLLPDFIDTHFLFHFFTFNYENVRSFGHGAHQKNLSATLIKSIKMSIPPMSEQKQIAETLSGIDDKIQAEQTKKNTLDTLFKTLLSLLMTGKIRVKDIEI